MSTTSFSLASTSESQGPAHSGPRKRILIAESDGFTRLMLIIGFRMAGLAVDFAPNGDLALGKLRRSAPDALLVELNLSGLPGLELIRSARQDSRFGSRPAFLFTHTDSIKRTVKKEIQRLGMNVFDKSSICIADLVETIASTLTGDPVPEQPKVTKPEKIETQTSAPLVPEAHLPEFQASGPALPADDINSVVDALLNQWNLLAQCQTDAERVIGATQLAGHVSQLRTCAGNAGLGNLAVQAEALEGFLYQLCQQPESIDDGAVALITRAVEVVGLLACGENEPGLEHFTVVIIGVSDASNEALRDALLAVGITPIVFAEPDPALAYLAVNPADLIIANVSPADAAGPDPFNIRQLPHHADTPIVFVPELFPSPSDQDQWSAQTPRLSVNPRLLTQLVMKSLDELKNKNARPKQQPPPALPPDLAATDIFVRNTDPAAARTAPPSKPVPSAEASSSFGLAAQPQPAQPGSVLSNSNGEGKETSLATSLASATEPVNGPSTIFFVEDDPFAVKIYKRALNRSGFNVEVAQDGLVAVETLSRFVPELVILDLMLPKLHGLEVLRFIRSESHLKEVPVLVLSNAYLDQLGARARKAGANAALSKIECTPQKLVDKVCELLGRAAATPTGNTAVFEKSGQVVAQAAGSAEETAIWVRQADLRKEAPTLVAQLRQDCLESIQITDPETALARLTDVYCGVRFLCAHATLSGFTKIAEVGSLLEGLLFEIIFNQLRPMLSTLRTISQAVDLLDELVRYNDTTYVEPRNKPRLLVVDNDPDANINVVTALNRGHFDVRGIQDSVEALRTLKISRFDLLLAEVNTPHLNAFQMCEQLRRMPQYKSIPVIFLTSDVQSLDRAPALANGNDLVDKSVSPLELVLKVIVHLLRQPPQGISADASSGTAVNTAVQSVQGIFDRLQATPGGAPPGLLLANAPVSAEAAAIPALQPGAPAQPADQVQLETRAEPSSSPEAAGGFTAASDPFVGLTAQPVLEAGSSVGQDSPVAAGESGQAPSILRPNLVSEANRGKDASITGTTASAADSGPDAEKFGDNTQGVDPFEGQAGLQPQAAAKLDPDREKLVNRIYAAENDLYRAQARIKRKDETIESLQKQLEEFSAFKSQSDQPKPQSAPTAVPSLPGQASEFRPANALPIPSGATQFKARSAQLEQELTTLRQAHTDLQAKLSHEQAVSADAAKRADELQQQLIERAAELARAKTELEQQSQDRTQVEGQLHRELETSAAAARNNEAAHQQTQARCAQLENELADVRLVRDDLAEKLAKAQQSHAASEARVKELERKLQSAAGEPSEEIAELEQRVEQAVAALSKVTGDLARERGERQRSEERAKALNLQLQTLHEETRRILDCHHEDQKRLGELEGQLRQQVETIGRTTADLEAEQAEHRLTQEQLQEAKDLNAHFRKNLSFFDEAKETFSHTHQDLQSRLDAALSSLHETSAQLQRETAQSQLRAANLEATQHDLDDQRRKGERLQTELQAALRALTENESKLREEAAERQRLNQALGSVQLEQARSQKAELELSNLRAALQLEQVERKRQEAQSAQMRQSTLASARGARLLRNSLRRQIRQPVENLYNSSRSLLQLEMGDEQRKLVEAILQDVLLVHTRLQEPDLPQDDPAQRASKPDEEPTAARSE